jgi:hypothetical protein
MPFLRLALRNTLPWPWLSMFTFPLDSLRELDVFRHDGDPLGMDGTQVWILKWSNKVRLRGFLWCPQCWRLKTQVFFVAQCNFPH